MVVAAANADATSDLLFVRALLLGAFALILRGLLGLEALLAAAGSGVGMVIVEAVVVAVAVAVAVVVAVTRGEKGKPRAGLWGLLEAEEGEAEEGEADFLGEGLLLLGVDDRE